MRRLSYLSSQIWISTSPSPSQSRALRWFLSYGVKNLFRLCWILQGIPPALQLLLLLRTSLPRAYCFTPQCWKTAAGITSPSQSEREHHSSIRSSRLCTNIVRPLVNQSSSLWFSMLSSPRPLFLQVSIASTPIRPTVPHPSFSRARVSGSGQPSPIQSAQLCSALCRPSPTISSVDSSSLSKRRAAKHPVLSRPSYPPGQLGTSVQSKEPHHG